MENEKKNAAICLIETESGYILAVSRKDDPTKFGLPGGKTEPDETLVDAAIRELKEETGLQPIKIVPVFSKLNSDGYVVTTFRCYVDGEINTDEAGVVRWVKPSVLVDGPFGDYFKEMFKSVNMQYLHHERFSKKIR